MLQKIYPPFVGNPGAVGLLIVRVVFGVALILHGLPKVTHPFDWMPAGAPIPGVLQLMSVSAEVVGGLALVVGFLTPLTAFVVAVNMIVATLFLSSKGAPWIGEPGKPSFESAFGYLAVAVTLLLTGPGRLSLDYLLLGRRRELPSVG